MTTRARVRKGALALPEVEEMRFPSLVTFNVEGRAFVELRRGGHVRFPLDRERVDELLAEHPAARPVLRDGEPVGIDLPLTELETRLVDPLLREAWEALAPERLLAGFPDPPLRGHWDLPPLGRAATAALKLRGITNLPQVAAHTREELLTLHGVNTETLRILEDELAFDGRSFAAGDGEP
jgi:hypothetical protein